MVAVGVERRREVGRRISSTSSSRAVKVMFNGQGLVEAGCTRYGGGNYVRAVMGAEPAMMDG